MSTWTWQYWGISRMREKKYILVNDETSKTVCCVHHRDNGWSKIQNREPWGEFKSSPLSRIKIYKVTLQDEKEEEQGEEKAMVII